MPIRELPYSPKTKMQNPWIVQKYGGTSLGKLLDNICGRIIPTYLEGHRVAVICSALSDKTKATGTASLLLECLRLAEVSDVESRRHRICEIIDFIRDSHVERLQSLSRASNEFDFLVRESIADVVTDCEETQRVLVAAQVCFVLSFFSTILLIFSARPWEICHHALKIAYCR